jgi:hypothetical protein
MKEKLKKPWLIVVLGAIVTISGGIITYIGLEQVQEYKLDEYKLP